MPLFKWFGYDLNISDAAFDCLDLLIASACSRADVARAFFAEVVAEAKRRRRLSAEHFMDGTLHRGLGLAQELTAARRAGP